MFSRWKIYLGICATLCLFSLGCDRFYKYLDKEGAEEKELIGEALPLESNAKIREIQTLLNLYGYGSGIPDGLLGFKTRQAIEKFQNDNGLKPTRFVDQATWQRLTAFEYNQLVVNKQLNIKLIQKILKTNGYEISSIDGKMGPKTLDAVKAFQKKYGLKPDGRIGYKTLSKLATYLQVEPVR